MFDYGPSLPTDNFAPRALQEDTALFLDFDGTLVESKAENSDVTIAPELPELLLGLRHRLQGAIAVVSGRSLTELDRFLAPASLAGAGLLGAELRLMAEGPIEASGGADLNRLACSLREIYSSDPQIVVDQADGHLKINLEKVPERADEVKAAVHRLATSRSIEVFERGGSIEARPHGCGKGVALRMLIEDTSFRGRRPVFVGNGQTDEDAFRAASAMGGFGIKIGEGDSAAAHRLRSVSDLHGWLAESLSALS
jgi:trehalose 6-phosphate phosphatase